MDFNTKILFCQREKSCLTSTLFSSIIAHPILVDPRSSPRTRFILNTNLKDNQIIIFTCSNREKEALDELGIRYNLIKLEN